MRNGSDSAAKRSYKMFVIEDATKTIQRVMATGTKDEKKRLATILTLTRNATEKAEALGLMKDGLVIEEEKQWNQYHEFSDKQTSEQLRVLNTMKRKMSHQEHLFNFYMIYQSYDGRNRDKIFKQALKIVEERVKKLDKEKKRKYFTAENDFIEVFRVGTINGTSWMSSVVKLSDFIRYWSFGSRLCGLLKCRVYRKLVCEDDILIYCGTNTRDETECILAAKTLRDCSLTDRLYETRTADEFSVKDAQGNVIVSTKSIEKGDESTYEVEDSEYLFGARDENTGELTHASVRDMVAEALWKSDGREAKIEALEQAVNDMNFNQSVLAA